MRIKKDDMVMVIAGKDKGRTGKVLKAMPKENTLLGLCVQQGPFLIQKEWAKWIYCNKQRRHGKN